MSSSAAGGHSALDTEPRVRDRLLGAGLGDALLLLPLRACGRGDVLDSVRLISSAKRKFCY